MTAPMIGNYGIAEEDVESARPQVAGFVIRELANVHSNQRAVTDLSSWLAKAGVLGIEGIDTRALVRRLRGGSGGERFTARTQAFGSGGEQAKLAHLPLFAAMAGYYASARPTAPHLVVLDEAFAGIDDDQRGDCMAMLVELDLDPVLANYSEWGCYPEVPQVAVYHLERTPGVPGVAALRFVWDGTALTEDDPFLDARTGSPPGQVSWVPT
jgi:hypothetical protein